MVVTPAYDWGQGVAGSNPVSPTDTVSPTAGNADERPFPLGCLAPIRLRPRDTGDMHPEGRGVARPTLGPWGGRAVRLPPHRLGAKADRVCGERGRRSTAAALCCDE